MQAVLPEIEFMLIIRFLQLAPLLGRLQDESSLLVLTHGLLRFGVDDELWYELDEMWAAWVEG